jgi:hypothetical protein
VREVPVRRGVAGERRETQAEAGAEVQNAEARERPRHDVHDEPGERDQEPAAGAQRRTRRAEDARQDER